MFKQYVNELKDILWTVVVAGVAMFL